MGALVGGYGVGRKLLRREAPVCRGRRGPSSRERGRVREALEAAQKVALAGACSPQPYETFVRSGRKRSTPF